MARKTTKKEKYISYRCKNNPHKLCHWIMRQLQKIPESMPSETDSYLKFNTAPVIPELFFAQKLPRK